MKGFHKVFKRVAVAISPLLLSFFAVLLLFLLLGDSLAPYRTALSLVLSDGEAGSTADEYENILHEMNVELVA